MAKRGKRRGSCWRMADPIDYPLAIHRSHRVGEIKTRIGYGETDPAKAAFIDATWAKIHPSNEE